jgi:hypothetical protein
VSTNSAIERILELSAEAQVKRREAAENSSAFHNLTGAILAYGKALGLLSKLVKTQRSPGRTLLNQIVAGELP